MRQFLIGAIIVIAMVPTTVSAHRSGCHRWHSCPSDTGSYTCGDAGYPCRYPTYSERTGIYIAPPQPEPAHVPLPIPTPPVVAPTPIDPTACTEIGLLYRKNGTEFYDKGCTLKRSINVEKLATQINDITNRKLRTLLIAATIQAVKGTAESQCLGPAIVWGDWSK